MESGGCLFRLRRTVFVTRLMYFTPRLRSARGRRTNETRLSQTSEAHDRQAICFSGMAACIVQLRILRDDMGTPFQSTELSKWMKTCFAKKRYPRFCLIGTKDYSEPIRSALPTTLLLSTA